MGFHLVSLPMGFGKMSLTFICCLVPRRTWVTWEYCPYKQTVSASAWMTHLNVRLSKCESKVCSGWHLIFTVLSSEGELTFVVNILQCKFVSHPPTPIHMSLVYFGRFEPSVSCLSESSSGWLSFMLQLWRKGPLD